MQYKKYILSLLLIVSTSPIIISGDIGDMLRETTTIPAITWGIALPVIIGITTSGLYEKYKVKDHELANKLFITAGSIAGIATAVCLIWLIKR
jgi:hypothetical protein